NLGKVSGANPDAGEALALRTLESFVKAVREIYGPGARLWVISDGHVFSDCIGVNDASVSVYDDMLRRNYRRHHSAEPNPCIKFLGLEDLLFSRLALTDSFESKWLDGLQLQHP